MTKMKKILIWVLILLSIVTLLIRFSSSIEEIVFGIRAKSGISILSNPDGATILLDGKEAGKTPYENKDLEVRETLVKIEKDNMSWEGKINLVAGAVTVINRDLSKDSASSAGEVLSLKRGKGMTIISSPSDADVEVDGKSVGKTPISFDVQSGEHTLTLTHANYLRRSIRAILPKGFNLLISSDLALSEADLTSISTPVITQTPQVVVKATPTGFLRVRDKASTSGKEIAQVKPGEMLILLEEQGSWDRVRLSDGTEGFVSSSYVDKKVQ